MKEKIVIESLPQEMSDTKSYRITMTRIVKFSANKATEALEAITRGYEKVEFK